MVQMVTIYNLFQSTLPAWGATNSRRITDASVNISIHAPRMGSDMNVMPVAVHVIPFQSTLPAWGATS